MLYMNTYDIERAAQDVRTIHDPDSRAVMTKAIQLLRALVTLVDEVSDGWAYWRAPCRAARQLQELIQAGLPTNRNNFTAPVTTTAQLRKAITPIKAFLTREARQLQGKTLVFPC